MAGNRLKLEVLAAGAIVPAFQMQDAVNAGILDGGHGVCAYWYGKNKAFSLFGTPPALGWDANGFLSWMNYGGGYDLYNELVGSIMKLNLVGFLTGPMPCQPLGWFQEAGGRSADDFKGLKYRTVGLAADLMREMGAAVTILAGGEIVPALERGVIDGAEFQQPVFGLAAGLPRRVEDVHDALFPSGRGSLRNHLQQGEVRSPPGRTEGDREVFGGIRLRRHAVEGA